MKDPDKLKIKAKKGVWKRFIKLFTKCRLPFVWLIIYIIASLLSVNIGLSETDYTAQLFAGDTSALLITKLVAVVILNILSSSLVIFVGAITSARINRNMRTVLVDKIMRLPMTFFKNDNPKEAIYRIVRNAIVINSTIMVVLIPMFTAVYTAVGVFGKVFSYDWRLSVILLVFIPIQILLAFIFGRLNYSVSERDSSVNAGLMQKLAELVTNIPLAKAFAKEQKEVENGEELTSRLYKINLKSSWISQFKNLSDTAVSLLLSIVIVFVGVLLLKNEEIAKRSWIAFFMFSSVFSNAISTLLIYWNNLKTIQGSADRIADIMDAPEEKRDGKECRTLCGSVKFEHIKFSYDESKPLLTDVCCEFKDNCITALLGISGCGKTTLINLLTRLYEPDTGTIKIGDESVHQYALDDYRNQFVVVSQNTMLFSGTVRENVCYGSGEVSDEKLKQALIKAGAYTFVEKMPNGVDTLLEEYGGNLSGGQKQRLSIARALLSDAHYLILDEPSASMDAIAAGELMEIIKEISKERCTIIIAHTASVLSLAERVVLLENGSVSAEGKTSELKNTVPFLLEFSRKKVTE